MFEKIIPIIAALILLQFAMKFLISRKSKQKVNTNRFDYKKRIDEFMKISNYDEGVGAGNKLSEDVRQGLSGDLLLDIPESMRGVRKDLNLIIDGVIHGVKAKIGERANMEKYNNAAEMFDEILEIINRHKL